jgi:cytochrome b subunit of formate dehydrogenase
MDDRTKELREKRRGLAEQLSNEIVESARPLIDPESKPEELSKFSKDAADRIEFEANVAFSEAVTRFSKKREKPPAADEGKRMFVRFGKNFRSQHLLMFLSVILLIITGIPLKFPSLGISKFIILDIFGGIQNSTLVHRVAAVGLIIVGAWHLGYIIVSRIGRRDFFLMIPKLQDAKDGFQTIMFFLGRRAAGPKFHRFSFIEKFDYWAVYWGMVIMIGSGLILWFKETFSKDFFDIAREAHSDEGLLATLAIIVWHFYNVHFNPDVFPMSWVWWHGKLSESQMKHHHPLEYAEIVNAELEQLTAKEPKDEPVKDNTP